MKMHSSNFSLIFSFLLLLGWHHIDAQSNVLSGRVTSESGEPLTGVSILVVGTQIGTASDLDGKFMITNAPDNAQLTFSYIGYVSVTELVGKRTTVDVVMKLDAALLEDVVVVGYGTVKKSDLTGSVASLKAADLKVSPIANFVQGLQARASGVQVTQNSGAPGGSISVRIRGNNSISGSSEPLYVIDGFPVAGGDNQVAGGGSSLGNDNGNRLSVLSTLNPNDIESIEVLKDASATAIYGTRGANGVVLITTKRGKKGETRVNYEGYYGQQQIRKTLDLLNATEFAKLENEVTGQTLYPNPEQLGEGTDWQSLIFRKSPIQSHQLSVSGGSDKSLFNVSMNYFNQDGIVVNSNFQRGSVRLNLDNQIHRNFKIGTNLTYTYSVNNAAVTATLVDGVNGGIVMSALHAPPTLAPYDDQGNPAVFSGRYLDINNPVAFTSEVLNRNTTRRLLGSIFTDWTIVEGLTYRASFGGDLIDDTRDSYVTRLIRSGLDSRGIGGRGHNATNTLLHESVLNYRKSFGVHDLGITGAFSTQSQNQITDASTGQQFPNDILINNNLGQAAVVSISSGRQSWRLDSYTGRINYGLKGKYLLTLTSRVDGSSRFGKNNKYGFFPSVATAWRIGEEPFLKSQNFIEDLKLRVSYGVTGNADIPLYNSLVRLGSVGNYNFNNTRTIGILSENIANPDLRWEKSSQLDLGLDFSLLDGRIQITTDLYSKTTNDLLLSRAVPLSSGYSAVFGNFGSVKNYGMEFSLNAKLINRDDLNWELGFNFSSNRNELTKIDGNRKEIIPSDGSATVAQFTNNSILRIGYPLGSFYGYVFDGIYQTGETIPTGRVAGNIRYKDLNGDGVISAADQTIIGDPNPDFYFGVNSNVKFKNFDLSLFVQGVQGNDIFFAQRLRLEGIPGTINQRAVVVDRWTATNPSNSYPRASQNQRINQSDIHIEDGSFVRFKNFTIGYTFSKNEKMKFFNQARAYFSANNFITLTNYSGYDPEVNTSGQSNLNLGVDNIGYPIAKSYLLGLQISF